MIKFGLVLWSWFGIVEFVWVGIALFGEDEFGLVWLRFVRCAQMRLGLLEFGMVWICCFCSGLFRFGLIWFGLVSCEKNTDILQKWRTLILIRIPLKTLPF